VHSPTALIEEPTPCRAHTAQRADTTHGDPGARYIVRRLVYPHAHTHGVRPLGDLHALDISALAELADAEPAARGPELMAVATDLTQTPSPKPQAPDECHSGQTISAGSLLFIDTETTALGGGAGVYVFLTGLGRLTRDGFEVEQWVLREPGGEAAMLRALRARIAAARLVVSFGGRSFDERMLTDRFRMHRIETPFVRRHHADLGTLSRALWKARLGSCTLGAIERAQLGHHRSSDLPGALCPAAYFHWLRTGAEAGLCGLEPVLTHNRDDVLSLVTLALELGHRTQHTQHPAELTGLGQHWRRRRRWERSRDALEHALAAHETPGLPTLAPVELATLYAELGRVLGRGGRYDEAAAALRELLRLPEPPIPSLVALAKLAEHRTRDLDLAERAATLALSLVRRRAVRMTPHKRQALEQQLTHRLTRLAHKRTRAAERVVADD
jgi:uncharacterized protein YprB with RNaseH-like and TPR domain